MDMKQFLISILFVSVSGCLVELNTDSCSCLHALSYEHVRCKDFDNYIDLLGATKSLIGYPEKFILTIENAEMVYVPSTAFQGMNLMFLEFQNSSIKSLTDEEFAFIGLENSLEAFFAYQCNFMNEWDFSKFRNLKELKLLAFIYGDLETIEELQMINLNKLIVLSFSHNEINYIEDKAFVTAENLLVLRLDNNEIYELKRSMLAYPASKLAEFSLSNNQLESFPDDMFTGMPNLKYLDIANNKIFFLQEKVFQPIWSQLELLEVYGNDIKCDCRMSWILNIAAKPNHLIAFCNQPEFLKGTELSKVSLNSLRC